MTSAQKAPTDCVNALTICGNTNLKLNSNGTGINDFSSWKNVKPSCQFVESQSLWIKVTIAKSGTLGFDLKPDVSWSKDDYDFAVYGPNVKCDSLGRAIRCSSTNPQAAGVSTSTGMNGSSSSNHGGPGASGTGYVKWLNAKQGETYYILIDNFSQNHGFILNWTGSAKLIEAPQTKTPKTVEICDLDGNNDGFAQFNLAPYVDTIIGTQKNTTLTFHTSERSAAIGSNPIKSKFTNTKNPQTIYARATGANKCFDVIKFKLQVNKLPIVGMKDWKICDDDDDGIITVDVSDITPDVLNGRNPSEFKVSYYYFEQDALKDINSFLKLKNAIVSQRFFGRIKDLNSNCADTFSFLLNVIPKLKPDLGLDTFVCTGGELTLDAGNQFDSYTWDDNSTSRFRKISTAGEYIVTTIIKGCESKDSINIITYKGIKTGIGNDTTVCEGTKLILDAKNPGSTYSWNTGKSTQTIEVIKAGYYQVIVNDEHCSDTSDINVEYQQLVELDLGNDTAFCENESHFLFAGSFGTAYKWNTGEVSNLIEVDSSGYYSVEVTMGACIIEADINITVHPIPQANLGNDTMMCQTLYTLSSDCEDCLHKWNTGATTKSIQVNKDGKYVVEVSKNGCKGTDDIEIKFIEQPHVYLGKDTILCDNILELDAQNEGNVYLWNTGEDKQKITVSKSGIYKVTLGINGCMDEDEIKVTIYNTPTFDLGNDSLLCEGQSYFLNMPKPDPSYNYLWEDGSNHSSREIKEAGKYWLKAFNTSCSVYDTISLEFIPKPEIQLVKDTFLCIGDSITLDVGPMGNRYEWNTGATSRTLVVTKRGFYSVVVYDNQCSNTAEIIINERKKPIIPLKDSYRICMDNKQVVHINPDDGRTYYWRPEEVYSKDLKVNAPDLIWVQYTDINQCESSKLINIVEGCDPYIWVPNAFTPDENNLNEEFKPVGKYIEYYHLRIFNQWGAIIFETNDLNQGWNGIYRGEECSQGVYWYQLSYNGSQEDGTKIGENLNGTIHLLHLGTEG